jgi:hypothetical protein
VDALLHRLRPNGVKPAASPAVYHPPPCTVRQPLSLPPPITPPPPPPPKRRSWR